MSDRFDELRGHLRSELLRRSRDPGRFMKSWPEEKAVGIWTGDDGGWCRFEIAREDLEDRSLAHLASEMVDEADAGCPGGKP